MMLLKFLMFFRRRYILFLLSALCCWEMLLNDTSGEEQDHARIQKSFVRGDQTLTTFLLFFNEGRDDPNTTISGASSARQRNAIFGVDDGPTLNAGLKTKSLSRNRHGV